ncbi:MAG: alpha-2-macroglobulin [Bosea sp. (in: a-proteobacteria)]|uniref:alpha-2-macroglobulin family protein n=1 Tax=Bosea sp. (in: a-proteobacteria) TaxID=1871050 RepID=UPI0027357A54|nr:alpha-2-macroglobulin [Bosea sp. (in: a-proteobacteria)]MDP3603043.1 alpha-2-macroglobulin [Bosea sp. (in: a-proteobacteria)]
MIGLIRAAALCATLALGIVTAQAAEKAFKRDDLQDSAIKLEAQIKSEAGAVAKSGATLKTDAEAAFKRSDFRTGLQILGQIAATSPDDSGNWLRLARAIFHILPKNSSEGTFLLERASTAAYIAYQRAGNAGEEADALAVLGRALADRKLWRPALDSLRLSLDMREVAEVRGQYEKLRDQHGFRLLDYSVDSDSASPRACFQFSEDLAKRVDFAPFLALAGSDKPALTSEGKQLCVDGLRHGERYNVNLRAGLPSTVRETLPKSAEFNIYVRDRKPFVRFTGRAYVLPRTGQRGIPLVTVNTPAVSVSVFRIGDRNLINTVLGSDFQQALSKYELSDLGGERGVKVWSGELATATTLNQDVTTAFPVDQALGDLQPGIYVMTAEAKGPGSDSEGSLATQWFIVSDLGLTAFSGNDGIHVFVNSLASTEAVARAEVRLVARNNEILATRKTDESGHVLFEAGLARGEGGLSPAMLTVSGEKTDYAFLSLKSNAFDLSDRGVSGRAVPAGADAFVYTERGVYRSSETVYLTALLRDGQGNAVSGGPLTLVIERPDGVEFRRAVLPDQGAGGRSMALTLNSAVPTGTWRARAFTDPKGAAVGETTFMVEDYIPERIEFELTANDKQIKADVPVELKVDGRFLYGAPASGLQLEGDMLVAPAAGLPGFAGYQFGVADEETTSNERTPLENLPEADAKGVAIFPVSLAKPPSSTRPQEAQIFVRMAEAGGRSVERKLVLPVQPATAMIGVKPLFADKSVAEGDKAGFDVVLVTPEGKQLARDGLRYELLKIESRYQWYRQHSSWEYEPVKSTRRVADGDVAVAADKPSRITLSPQPGRYRLDVKSTEADGPLTSVQFDVGWYSDGSADTPDLLETSIDKPEYLAGDTMVVSVNARSAGRLTINVLGDRLLTTQSINVKEGTAQVKIPVGKDWGTGAYVVATLRRPLDAAALRMPGRAIGLKWFGIDKKSRTLTVDLSPPALVRPGTALKIPVKLGGLNPGEDAKIVVAAVDVGILNLTRFESPDPSKFFFGQRQIGHELRDLYGYLIDGMQGTRGAIRSGGDAAPSLEGEKPTQEPVARYSGVVKVGPDGIAKVDFELPAFNGSLRVMAVAWSAGRTGQASTEVIVRDPVVAQATLPRFLAIGDQSRFHLQIDNVEGPAGPYVVDLDIRGPVLVPTDATRRTIQLAAGAKAQMTIPVTAAGLGRAEFDVRISGPGGVGTVQNLAVRVQPSAATIARRIVRPIPGNGGAITVSADLLADLVPGSGQVSVSVSPLASLDVPALLKALDRYPYGCTEQTVSRAMPLLHVNRLASLEHLALDANADERVQTAIERVLARQGANGSFGLWGVGGDDLWLDAFTADFLTRARERQFPVPQTAFNLALDRLRNQVVNTGEIVKEDAAGIAYALYVLARNGRPVMGDLRYLADNKLADFATPMARAQIGAALSALGDRGRGRAAFVSALAGLQERGDDSLSRPDYGSRLRDGAAVLALIAESAGDRAEIGRAAAILDGARNAARSTSTQEQAWMVLAAQAMAKDAEGMTLTVDGTERKGPLYRTLSAAALEQKPLTVANPAAATAQAVITVAGIPTGAEPALNQGFGLERVIYTMKGEKADPARLRQNERYVVALTVTEPASRYGRLLLVDPVPAGLEIENANLTEGASVAGLDWLKQEVYPVHTEARDDRYVAAFERSGGNDQKLVYTVAYIARAVSPGRYVAPAAVIEDMYRPDRFGRTGFGTVDIASAR